MQEIREDLKEFLQETFKEKKLLFCTHYMQIKVRDQTLNYRQLC